MPSPVRDIAGIEPLIERYDGFLLDQFGVLHDGAQALPGAIEALRLLSQAGKTVVLLSNSGKRSPPNEERLSRFGIERPLYSAMVTSGDVAWEGLRLRRDAIFAGLGHRCVYVSRGEDITAVAGLDLTLVSDPAAADFLLLGGLDASNAAIDRARELVSKAVRLKLPILCTNPDLVSLDGAKRFPGPGRLASDAALLGADVRWVGKPWPQLYERASVYLSCEKARIVGIGDSPIHDIAGANGFGIDSCLVLMGVHRTDDGPSEQLVAASQIPTWRAPAFAPASLAPPSH